MYAQLQTNMYLLYCMSKDNTVYSEDITKKRLWNVLGNGMRMDWISSPERFFPNGVMAIKFKSALNKGDGFGEIGLVNPKGRRTATIIARTDCHFACISREDYEEIFDMFMTP